MHTKDYKPLCMWLLLVAGIIIITLLRPGRLSNLWTSYPCNLDMVFAGLYLLWMLAELRVAKEDTRTHGKRRADAATCQIYGTAQFLTILSALWCAPLWQAPHPAHFWAMGIFMASVAYRLWAIRTLGEFYSHRVQVVAQHRVISTGPYRIIRHPAYAGMLMAHAAVCLFFFNWVSLSILLGLLLPAILVRIRIEEKTLLGIEGYAAFAATRKRLIPGIW